MTTKERLHQLVDELSEREADETLQFVVARHQSKDVDEWGDTAKVHEIAFEEKMRRLAEEESAGKHRPW